MSFPWTNPDREPQTAVGQSVAAVERTVHGEIVLTLGDGRQVFINVDYEPLYAEDEELTATLGRVIDGVDGVDSHTVTLTFTAGQPLIVGSDGNPVYVAVDPAPPTP